MSEAAATEGPWRSEEHRTQRDGLCYISIRGPNNEKICDIFPLAGKGGVGEAVARKNARLIIEARARSGP